MAYILHHLLSLVISATFSVCFFVLFHYFGPRFIPMPPRIVLLDDKKEKYEAYRRYIAIYSSTAHGVCCIMALGWILYKDGITLDEPNYTYHYIFFGFSSGYYIIDTIAGIVYNFGGVVMTFHHIMMLVIFAYICYKQRYAGIFSYLMFLGEVSNPLMHVRKNLMQFNNTRLYTDILGILFCVMYIICRMVLIGLISYDLSRSTVCMGFKVLLCIIWYFSLIWSVSVAGFLFKGLAESYPHPIFNYLYEQVQAFDTEKVRWAFKHSVFIYMSFAKLRYSQHTEWF